MNMDKNKKDSNRTKQIRLINVNVPFKTVGVYTRRHA